MDINVRLKILSRMAQSETEAAKATIEKEIMAAALTLEKETDFARLEDNLAIIKAVGFRNSEVAVAATVALIKTIEERELTYSEESMMVAMFKDYRTPEALLTRAIETLVVFRYWQTVQVLHALIPLSQHSSERIRKKAVNGLELLAKYDLDIFYGNKGRGGIGAIPQQSILDELERLEKPTIQKYLSAVLALLDNLLSPEMEGATWSYKALTLTRKGTPADAGIPNIRSRSIEFLKRIYLLAPEVKHKLHVIGVMTSATRTVGAKLHDESRKMFVRDAKSVLGFFSELAVSDDLEVVQKIEHNSYWIVVHAIDPEITTAALQVETEVAKNAGYQLFRTLIGFDGIFGKWQEVKDSEFDPGKIDELRKRRAREYVASITESNYAEWRTRILTYAEVESDDLATFPIFYYFLEKFAANKPDLALRLLSEDSERLKRFLIPPFRGLWAGPRRDAFRDLLLAWIEKGRYLYAATKQFLSNPDVDLDLLRLIFRKALEMGDMSPIREMISVTISNYSTDKAALTEELMLPALEVLTKNGDTSWIFDSWFRKEIEGVLEALNEGGIDLILHNLSALKKIDYHAERVLTVIAKKRPGKVLRLFLDRLQREAGGNSNDESRFEAIPFELHELKESLSTIPGVAVPAIREQYDGNYGLLIHRGAHLLKIIFPQFPPELEAELLKLVKEGGDANLEFVLAVLRNYEGRPVIQAICKEIVKAIAPDSPLRSDVAIALESTGVVSGEFGMAEAYERKRTELEGWLNDPNENIQGFAKQYLKDLQAMSSTERKRAQEQIELRKFKYGEE